LIRELVAFCRRQAVHPQALDLSVTLTERTTLLGGLLGEGVRINLNVASDTEPVLLDPGQLDLILVHIAENARDAMGGQGTFAIETRRLDVRERGLATVHGEQLPVPFDMPPGPYLQLLFSDTGCGMSPDALARCFEPFFTTKESRDLVAKTPGLGLSAVYGAVTRSGGYIEVASSPGQGTTLTISFPVRRT
jgi:signal transduction histidine kinase